MLSSTDINYPNYTSWPPLINYKCQARVLWVTHGQERLALSTPGGGRASRLAHPAFRTPPPRPPLPLLLWDRGRQQRQLLQGRRRLGSDSRLSDSRRLHDTATPAATHRPPPPIADQGPPPLPPACQWGLRGTDARARLGAGHLPADALSCCPRRQDFVTRGRGQGEGRGRGERRGPGRGLSPGRSPPPPRREFSRPQQPPFSGK